MAAYFQTTFSNTFSWMTLYEFRFKISLKFVCKGPIDNNPALVQKMAWRRPGDKPFSELMMVRLPTHISVTRPQWIKWTDKKIQYFGLSEVPLLETFFLETVEHFKLEMYSIDIGRCKVFNNSPPQSRPSVKRNRSLHLHLQFFIP